MKGGGRTGCKDPRNAPCLKAPPHRDGGAGQQMTAEGEAAAANGPAHQADAPVVAASPAAVAFWKLVAVLRQAFTSLRSTYETGYEGP